MKLKKEKEYGNNRVVPVIKNLSSMIEKIEIGSKKTSCRYVVREQHCLQDTKDQ